MLAPVVDGGKVERARVVTAASLATAFSLRAKWCPLTSFGNLTVYCCVVMVMRSGAAAPLQRGLLRRFHSGLVLLSCPLLAVSSAAVRFGAGRMEGRLLPVPPSVSVSQRCCQFFFVALHVCNQRWGPLWPSLQALLPARAHHCCNSIARSQRA